MKLKTNVYMANHIENFNKQNVYNIILNILTVYGVKRFIVL